MNLAGSTQFGQPEFALQQNPLASETLDWPPVVSEAGFEPVTVMSFHAALQELEALERASRQSELEIIEETTKHSVLQEQVEARQKEVCQLRTRIQDLDKDIVEGQEKTHLLREAIQTKRDHAKLVSEANLGLERQWSQLEARTEAEITRMEADLAVKRDKLAEDRKRWDKHPLFSRWMAKFRDTDSVEDEMRQVELETNQILVQIQGRKDHLACLASAQSEGSGLKSAVELQFGQIQELTADNQRLESMWESQLPNSSTREEPSMEIDQATEDSAMEEEEGDSNACPQALDLSPALTARAEIPSAPIKPPQPPSGMIDENPIGIQPISALKKFSLSALSRAKPISAKPPPACPERPVRNQIPILAPLPKLHPTSTPRAPSALKLSWPSLKLSTGQSALKLSTDPSPLKGKPLMPPTSTALESPVSKSNKRAESNNPGGSRNPLNSKADSAKPGDLGHPRLTTAMKDPNRMPSLSPVGKSGFGLPFPRPMGDDGAGGGDSEKDRKLSMDSSGFGSFSFRGLGSETTTDNNNAKATSAFSLGSTGDFGGFGSFFGGAEASQSHKNPTGVADESFSFNFGF